MPVTARFSSALGASLLLHGLVAAVSWLQSSDVLRALWPEKNATQESWFGDTFDVEALELAQSRARSEMVVGAEAEPVSRASSPLGVEAVPLASPEGLPALPKAGRTRARRSQNQKPPQVSSEGEAAKGAGTQFGAQGLPPGTRNLTSAFTRAIPAAVARDTLWSELPLGRAGQFKVTLELDEQGHLLSSDTQDSARLPEHIARLRERTLLLLRGGQFALADKTGSGKETLLVEVTLSQRELREPARQTQVVDLGYEPPTREKPGRGYFTLGSGRHFEARVKLLKHR